MSEQGDLFRIYIRRAEAAEAELKRLREGLEGLQRGTVIRNFYEDRSDGSLVKYAEIKALLEQKP